MEWLTNELIFNIGIVLSAAAAVAGLLHLIVSVIRTRRLRARLNAEYGAEE